jgi:hypothetical protein
VQHAGDARLVWHACLQRFDLYAKQLTRRHRPAAEGRPRCHVMASFATSLGEFDRLYRELAK